MDPHMHVVNVGQNKQGHIGKVRSNATDDR